MNKTTHLIRAFRQSAGFGMKLCVMAVMTMSHSAQNYPALPGLLSSPDASLTPHQAAATVTGLVSDEKGEGPQGVSSLATRKTTGATTSSNDILVFSFVGYVTKEVAVGNQTTIDVQMEVDAKSLEELVVVGYGTVKKSDLTGSVSTLQVSDMIKAPVGNFADALAGRAAGVRVFSNDGQPGGGVNIMIRGAGSLTQSTAPL